MKKGDTVRIKVHSCWINEIGKITEIVGPNIYVQLPSGGSAVPFTKDEIELSQETLPI